MGMRKMRVYKEGNIRRGGGRGKSIKWMERRIT